MQPYSYAPYPSANGAAIYPRYTIPPNYSQNAPPIANQPINPYNRQARPVRPPQYGPMPVGSPARAAPPGYRPRYPAPGLPPPPMSTMVPVMRPQQWTSLPSQQWSSPRSQQWQPSQGYYYGHNGSNGFNPAALPGFTAGADWSASDGQGNQHKRHQTGAENEENDAVTKIVSNQNVRDLLNQQGTKVKVSKIYRITKTKPDIKKEDSSDDDVEKERLQPVQTQAKKPSPRPPSSVSSCSHCSTCSNCSCSECRIQRQPHPYDDCPQCRLEQKRVLEAQKRRN